MLCAGRVAYEAPAWTRGVLWRLPHPCHYPGMTLGDSPVHGWVLCFDDDGLRAQLDELEGYSPARPPEENEYNTVGQEVFAPEGEPLGVATVYVMSPKRVRRLNGASVPDGKWQEAQ